MSAIETPPHYPTHAYTMADNVRRDTQGIRQFQSTCTCGWQTKWLYDRRASAYKLRRHIESEDWKSDDILNVGERQDYSA